MVLHTYAMLNENDICYGFESLVKKLNPVPSNMVYLPEYNETYLWKKYDRNLKAFSQESYEPSIDTILQEKIEEVETENQQLKDEIYNLNENIQLLEGTIAELMSILGGMQ